MWTTDTKKHAIYILCNLKNELLYVIKLSLLNYCTSLNCSVDIRGARRLNHRYFAMWTTDTKNTRYILCNFSKNELLYVIKIVQWISEERGYWTTDALQCEPPTLKKHAIYTLQSQKMNYCTSLNCLVDIRGAGRLNHRYFAMWTTDTKNTRYILCNFSKMNYCTSLNCNLKNEYCTSLNCPVDIRGAGRLNHQCFAMWTIDTKNTRYILCNLKNELLYVIKLFSGYQGSEAIEPPMLCNVNHRH